MAANSEAALAHVDGFTITRPGKGRLRWLAPVDVRGLQLDQIINIGQGVHSDVHSVAKLTWHVQQISPF
jgi:Nucleoporin autopeptidase